MTAVPSSMPGSPVAEPARAAARAPATASAVRASRPKMLDSHADAKPSAAARWTWSDRSDRAAGPLGSASEIPMRMRVSVRCLCLL